MMDHFEKSKILIVDDQPANVMLLADILDDEGLENIETLTDSRLVQASVTAERPAIILLDIRMPFMDVLRC
jgi:CheY-like chemotaxis protein